MSYYFLPHAPLGTESSTPYEDHVYETLLMDKGRAGANEWSLFAKALRQNKLASCGLAFEFTSGFLQIEERVQTNCRVRRSRSTEWLITIAGTRNGLRF